MDYSPNATWLVTSRHGTTRHVRRVEPKPFGCVELVEQHGSTLSRHDELDSVDTFDTSSSTGSTRRKL